MNPLYETMALDWHGIAVTVRYCPDWSPAWSDVHGHALCHIEIISPDSEPLPLTETGYLSMFVSAAVLDAWGGPLPYVRGGLDMGARDPEWIERDAKRQLTFF